MRKSLIAALWCCWVTVGSHGGSPYVGQDEDTEKVQQAKSRRKLRPVSAPLGGDSRCPCLSPEQVALSSQQEQDLLGPLVNASMYGIGCRDHDVSTRLCADQTCSTERRCDQAWCEKYWCYVDPNKCYLKFRKSRTYPNMEVQISYATCYEMDEQNLYPSLSGQTLKVGANTNTGGWKGSYRTPPGQFDGPLEAWSGPLFEFVTEAARTANFTIELVEPPSFLLNRSNEYFSSESSFDLCIYTAALGFADFCVAEYNINEIRASSADFIALGSNPLYLILNSFENSKALKGWDDFAKNFQNLFLPFEAQVWMLLIFGMIPLMGCLMLVHEYDHPGGVYKKYETVVVTSNQNQFETKVEERQTPVYTHIIKSIYVALLAVLQLKYDSGVVSLGAKIHLLGISVLTLTVTAVYTANLAAILTTKAREVPISSLADAIDKRYTFCANRNVMNTAVAVNFNLHTTMFAVDPTDEGGDGLPGFNCKNCAGRSRTFNFLDIDKANAGDRRYCHAAVASEEDLVVFQASGLHCNKTLVGEAIAHTTWGIPVNSRVSSELLSLFFTLAKDQVYESILDRLEPKLKCGGTKIVLTSDSSVALDLNDLTGIWAISLGFAVLGMLAKCFKYLRSGGKENVRRIVQYDQAGHRRTSMIDLLEESNHIKEYEARYENVTSIVEASSRLSNRLGTVVNAESLQRMLRSHSGCSDDDLGGNRGSGMNCCDPVFEGDEEDESFDSAIGDPKHTFTSEYTCHQIPLRASTDVLSLVTAGNRIERAPVEEKSESNLYREEQEAGIPTIENDTDSAIMPPREI
jgi:Ligand-gated ion channel